MAPDELELLDVPEADIAQMGRFLRLNTEGHINTMVKSSVERGEHVLETWRCSCVKGACKSSLM